MNNYHTILNGIQRRIIRAYQQRNFDKLKKLNMWKLIFTTTYLVFPWAMIQSGTRCDITFNGQPYRVQKPYDCQTLQSFVDIGNSSYALGEIAPKSPDEKRQDLDNTIVLGIRSR